MCKINKNLYRKRHRKRHTIRLYIHHTPINTHTHIFSRSTSNLSFGNSSINTISCGNIITSSLLISIINTSNILLHILATSIPCPKIFGCGFYLPAPNILSSLVNIHIYFCRSSLSSILSSHKN